MKIFIGIILTLTLIAISLFISFRNITSFINVIDIEEPIDGDDKGYTMPSKKEIKFNVFASRLIMRPAYKSIVKKIELNGDERVMDFGSGAGPASEIIAEALQEERGQLTCLDISETWMKVIKQRLKVYNHVDYLLGDITAMDLEENTYDVILVHFVLHDIDREIRSAIIEKLSYILKPGGKLVIREPSGEDHGMPGEEIQTLMKENGLQEETFDSKKILLFVPVNEGIFQK